jgi:hypothetical protein
MPMTANNMLPGESIPDQQRAIDGPRNDALAIWRPVYTVDGGIVTVKNKGVKMLVCAGSPDLYRLV